MSSAQTLLPLCTSRSAKPVQGLEFSAFSAPLVPGQESDDSLKTTFIADPDGRRIELVQWPAGHTDGMTAADWPEEGE